MLLASRVGIRHMRLDHCLEGKHASGEEDALELRLLRGRVWGVLAPLSDG